MPDLIEIDANAKIAETMQKLYPQKPDKGNADRETENFAKETEDLL